MLFMTNCFLITIGLVLYKIFEKFFGVFFYGHNVQEPWESRMETPINTVGLMIW